MENKLAEVVLRLVFILILGVVFSFWTPSWFFPYECLPWYSAWFFGSLHGSIAPVTWAMSFFTYNIVKEINQSGIYGFFWWFSCIASCIAFGSVILSVILYAIGKLFK